MFILSAALFALLVILDYRYRYRCSKVTMCIISFTDVFVSEMIILAAFLSKEEVCSCIKKKNRIISTCENRIFLCKRRSKKHKHK